jgi:hypothetical protein
VSLYVRAVFSDKFAHWVNRRRPNVDSFLAAWPKSKPRKPDREVELGNVSSIGKARTNVDRIGIFGNK